MMLFCHRAALTWSCFDTKLFCSGTCLLCVGQCKLHILSQSHEVQLGTPQQTGMEHQSVSF